MTPVQYECDSTEVGWTYETSTAAKKQGTRDPKSPTWSTELFNQDMFVPFLHKHTNRLIGVCLSLSSETQTSALDYKRHAPIMNNMIQSVKIPHNQPLSPCFIEMQPFPPKTRGWDIDQYSWWDIWSLVMERSMGYNWSMNHPHKLQTHNDLFSIWTQ